MRGFVDEIVVLDSGSSDATEKIARRFEAKFHRRTFDDFRRQRAHALSLCSFNWVLELVSDEVVSPAFATRLTALKAANFAGAAGTLDADAIRRGWFLLSNKIHSFYPSQCPDRLVRLFQRSKTGYTNARAIHESVVGHAWADGIDEPILHYTCDTLDQMYSKVNHYTTLLAQQMHQPGERASWLKILTYPWLIWFKYYVLYGGWRDGELGLVHGRYVRDTVWQKLIKFKFDCDPARTTGPRVRHQGWWLYAVGRAAPDSTSPQVFRLHQQANPYRIPGACRLRHQDIRVYISHKFGL